MYVGITLNHSKDPSWTTMIQMESIQLFLFFRGSIEIYPLVN